MALGINCHYTVSLKKYRTVDLSKVCVRNVLRVLECKLEDADTTFDRFVNDRQKGLWYCSHSSIRVALQIQDRSQKSRPVSSLNQSQTQMTRPVATGLALQRGPGVSSADPRHESGCGRHAHAVSPNTVVYRIQARTAGRPRFY